MSSFYYPYFVTKDCHTFILIWFSENGKDVFLKSDDGKLYSATDKHEVKIHLGDRSTRVNWKEAVHIDLDSVWSKLETLKDGTHSDTETCIDLLSAFNFFDDARRTFLSDRDFKSLNVEGLDHIYDKLFWGNNIKAVTPEGKSYSPIWNKKEISTLRTYLDNALQFYCKI